MTDVLSLLARYEAWIYGLLGLSVLFYLRAFWVAYQRLERTPFGLEKDAARRNQNSALAALFVVLALGLAVFGLNRYATFGPGGAAATPPPERRLTPVPSPTPIQSVGPLRVDSSGCDNPDATLTQPATGERIAGSYEIKGTANVPNFAFYKVEISGAATGGAWVTVSVGNVPRVGDSLGTFDTSPYQPGEYAFRLVVTDNMGDAAPPCVIAVSFGPSALPTPAVP